VADGEGVGVGRWAAQPGVSLFAPEVGARICARLATGESLSAICREAWAPCRNTVCNWAATHLEFGEALRGALLAVRVA
jgi:hypothetical protein